jgi:hypothetical protein
MKRLLLGLLSLASLSLEASYLTTTSIKPVEGNSYYVKVSVEKYINQELPPSDLSKYTVAEPEIYCVPGKTNEINLSSPDKRQSLVLKAAISPEDPREVHIFFYLQEKGEEPLRMNQVIHMHKPQ